MVRVPMACQKCSASKLRCDGSQPCRRCSDKDLRCTYVKRSRRRVKEGPVPPVASQVYRPASEDMSPISETSQMDTITLHQDPIDSIDARALDALSQAAIQARTPPLQSTDIDRQSAQRANYFGSRPSNSGSTFLPQAVDHISEVVHPSTYGETNFEQPFAPASPPRSNITNEMEGSWVTNETLNHMSFDCPTPDGHDDRTSEVSNLESLGLFPLWDTTFDITDWTTLEYDFHVDMAAPSSPSDNRPESVMGPQLSSSTFATEVRPPHHLVHSPTQNHRHPMRQAEQAFNTSNPHDKSHPQSNASNVPTPRMVIASNNPHAPPIPAEREGSRRDGDNDVPSTNITRHDPKAHPEQWPTDWDPGKSDNVLSFPDLQGTPQGIFDAENFSHVPQVSQHVYDSISHSIDQTSRDQVLFRPFLDSAPPSLEALNCFVQLYFEHFQPIFPLLHQPTFDPTSAHWILVLAVAAIGCRYSKVKDSAKCATALEELLRRAIQHIVSLIVVFRCFILLTIQVRAR